MNPFIVAYGSFLIVGALFILLVDPSLFGFVKGLFDNNDLGTVMALIACAFITVVVAQIAAMIALVAMAFTE